MYVYISVRLGLYGYGMRININTHHAFAAGLQYCSQCVYVLSVQAVAATAFVHGPEVRQ